MDILAGKRILLGVTGGIAAYKAPDLVSRLKKCGAEVKVVMTPHAEEFVTPLTFQTMSENVVYTNMFSTLDRMDVEHIALAKWADLIVIAPATANTIAKLAHGIADNMLTTVLLARHSPILIAPAMNTRMLHNIATFENLEILKDRGMTILPTEDGRLACGDIGGGKMLAPERIVTFIRSALTPKDLLGKKLLISAGGTQEPVDPVRYIGNRSSGKMGYCLAEAARDRGAEVVLVSGPTMLHVPEGIDMEHVETTQEMFDAVGKHIEWADAYLSPAAPADYRVASPSDQKIKKTGEHQDLHLDLVENPDILRHYASQKGERLVVGFAAESENLEEYAEAKRKKKNLDFIVANNITMEGAGFSKDTNIVTILDEEGAHPLEKMSKMELAHRILDRLVARWKKES